MACRFILFGVCFLGLWLNVQAADTDIKINEAASRATIHSQLLHLELNLENLATIASNCPEVNPVLVNGRPVKGLNARYNQHKARLQSQL